MEVPQFPFLRLMLPRAAASLMAACLVVSCATFPDTPSSQADGRSPAAAGDVGIERVVLQAYRAIGDRHLYEPNFRNLSVEAYRGFASNDSTLMLEASETTLTVKRDGKEIVSRPAPSDPTDGRAWGSTLTELMAGSIVASPTLQQVDRQVLIRQAMTATTKQLDRNSRYADPDEAKDNRFQRDGGGGIGGVSFLVHHARRLRDRDGLQRHVRPVPVGAHPPAEPVDDGERDLLGGGPRRDRGCGSRAAGRGRRRGRSPTSVPGGGRGQYGGPGPVPSDRV